MTRQLLARVMKALAALAVAITCASAMMPAAQAQLRPFVPGVQIVPGQKVYYPQQTAPAPAAVGDASWVMPASHGYGNCPCPDPHGAYAIPLGQPAPIDAGDDAVGSGATDTGEALPEVADVAGDVTYASAPQSAVPNSIGDSLGGCGSLNYFNGVDPPAHVDVCPAGGRQFKIAHNNSAVPRCRVFYTYNHFDEAVGGTLGNNSRQIDVDRYEFGYEYAFCCGLASIQLNVPFSNTIASHIDEPTLTTLPRDTELGNVSLAFKFVAYQDCCKTISVGMGIDEPTANDIVIEDANGFFVLENDTVTLSPFIAMTAELSCKAFFNGFVQFAIPINSNDVDFGIVGFGGFDRELNEMPLLYVDLSFGSWLYRDCCTGNGVAVIGEFHYTTSLEDTEFIELDLGGGSVDFRYLRHDIINLTLGVTTVYNKWDATVAGVVPVTDNPDQFFDWEAAVQVNRRF